MRKSIILPLNGQELMELQRILPDNEAEAALEFLKRYLDKQIRGLLSDEGH